MAERTRAGEGLWAQKQHQKPKTQSWGLRAAGRDSPEGPTTATSSPSATQDGSRLLTGHLHQAGPMGLHEQTIPGALRRCSQGIARPCGDNTAVISHQQIPNSISRTVFNFAFIYISSQWKNVGFGGNIPAVTGKDPLQQRFSGSWWGVVSFSSASANTFFLPSSVCFTTFRWEILKEKSGFFYTAIITENTAHPKQLQQNGLGSSGHVSRPSPLLPQPSQPEGGEETSARRGQLLGAGWKQHHDHISLPFVLTPVLQPEENKSPPQQPCHTGIMTEEP